MKKIHKTKYYVIVVKRIIMIKNLIIVINVAKKIKTKVRVKPLQLIEKIKKKIINLA